MSAHFCITKAAQLSWVQKYLHSQHPRAGKVEKESPRIQGQLELQGGTYLKKKKKIGRKKSGTGKMSPHLRVDTALTEDLNGFLALN